jgi:hypothetical protein
VGRVVHQHGVPYMFEIPNHDGAETSGVSGINKVTHEKLCGCTSTLAHIPHSSHLALRAGGSSS